MAWATTFRDISFEQKSVFLLNYLHMRPSDKDDLYEPYCEVLKYIVGGLYECDEYRYISKGVQELNLKPSDLKPKKSTKVPEGTTKEHTVPQKLVIDYLLSLKSSDMTLENIIRILKSVAGIGLIKNDEDEKLNDAELKAKLPNGITVDDIVHGRAKHSARYDTVGIKYSAKW